MDNNISIVTMFFDIGRGDWSVESGYASHLHRNNDKYFEYFKNLAKLENDLTIFTSKEFEKRIREIRKDKPTHIIVIDINNKLNNVLKRISSIQKGASFIDKVPNHQLENPEYWSEKYVLITNLKTYFVNYAISKGLAKHNQVAWIDFGYCRNSQVLGSIQNWRYTFNDKHVHFFTIKNPYYLGLIKNPHFPHSVDQCYEAIFHNKATIIGGVIVGSKENWKKLLTQVGFIQKKLLSENIVTADQGVFVLSRMYCKNLIKLHFLGKGNWFGVFERFHE